MCLHVCRDTLVYQAVRADSKKHLPRFYKFIKMRLCRSCTDQMDAEKRENLMKRANAFFVAAKASHLEWNASTFTRSRHILASSRTRSAARGSPPSPSCASTASSSARRRSPISAPTAPTLRKTAAAVVTASACLLCRYRRQPMP